MPSTPATGTRRERHDTQTLVRLDTAARESGPGPVPKPPEPSAPETLEVGRPANVHLWFQGVREPVRACAELSEAGLTLDAPLPFLALDSEVGCMPVGGGAVVHGRIRSVELDTAGAEGVPHLRVAVDLEESVDAGEAEDLYGALAQELEASDAHDDDASRAQNQDTLPPARNDDASARVVPILAAVMLGLAAGAGVAYAWIGTRPPPPAAVPAPPPPALPPHMARTDVGPRVEPPAIVIALAAENTDELAKSQAAQWLLASDPLAQLSVTPPQLLEEDYEVDPIPPPEVALEDEPSAAGGESGRGFLQVRAEGAQTRVFVPLSGTADGMRQYALTTPGIVFSLPHASALAPLENYAVPRGLVRRVWLRRVRDGVQVRVITRRTASRVSTTFDPDGLTVVLDM